MDIRIEIGSTYALPKSNFNLLLARIQENGFQTIGPRVEQNSLVYEEIHSLEDLPQGYVSEQEAGHFRLVYTGHTRFFDVIPGAHSWKQFLFPPRMELFKLHKNEDWKVEIPDHGPVKYAFIGVRSCELAAIQIQDNIFIRSDFVDPVYYSRRKELFILAVNCMHPAGACFCTSMNTGPKVETGFDLLLTELDDVFLIKVGSEIGRETLGGLNATAASAFVLQAANRGMERAAHQITRQLDTSDLPRLILDNLDHPHWHTIAKRCLSCANCTQVCPTCFCWDTIDSSNLTNTTNQRVRVWDSCFNPGYSYQAGGNTRPTIHSRYRQWLSHKLGTWSEQFDTLGCVGCGRCIVWCPAGIDLTQEIPAFRKGAKA